MSQTIENRIVEMQFENKQFESGVQESLSTLDKLKKALKFNDASKNLNDFSKQVNKNIDLSHVQDSITTLSDRFSTLRLVGIHALNNIVDAAMAAGKRIANVLTAPIQQIKTGGWSRAMNIEDAKFQLEGLGIAWETVADNIDYAVSGTAYSLDAAAKACAQLSASGVQAGDDMAKALRAISGVAAMGNTEYENIADIFTKAAGNGRVMADELNRISAYGLNARATLKDFFNDIVEGNERVADVPDHIKAQVEAMTKGLKVTESEISDFASHSEISFEIFYRAMDLAFGEHAKKANDTFTGALRNIKSALSRTGQKFAEPLIQNAIPVLNKIRELVNAINSKLGPFANAFANITSLISKSLVNKLSTAIDFVTNKSKVSIHLYNAFRNIVESLVKVFGTLADAFRTVFPKTKEFGSGIESLAEGIEKVTEKLIPSNSALTIFKTIMVGVFNVIKLIGNAIKLAWPVVTNVLATAGKIAAVIVNIIATIINLVSQLGIVRKVMDAIRESGGLFALLIEKLRAAFNYLRNVMSDTSTVTGRFAAKMKSAISTIVYIVVGVLYNAFTKIREFITGMIDSGDPLGYIINSFKNLLEHIKQIPTLFKQFGISEKIMSGLSFVLDKLGIGISKIIGLFKTLGGIIKSVFGIFSEDKVVEKDIEIPLKRAGKGAEEFSTKLTRARGAIKKTSDDTGSDVEALRDKIDRIKGKTQETKGAFSSLADMLSYFGGKIREVTSGIRVSHVILATFAGIIILIAWHVSELIKALGGLTRKLSGGFFSMFKTGKTTFEKFSEGLVMISASVAMLAGSIYMLKDVPVDKIKEITSSLMKLVGLIGVLGLLSAVITTLMARFGGGGGFSGFATIMLGFSLGVASLVGALFLLQKLEIKELWPEKVKAIVALMGALAGVSVLMSKFAPVLSNGGLSLIAFSVSIILLVKALQQLKDVPFDLIKANWMELSAVIVAFGVFGALASKVGIGAIIGIGAFLLALKYLFNHLEEVKAIMDKYKILETVKNVLLKIKESITTGFQYLVDTYKSFTNFEKFCIMIGTASVGVVSAILAWKFKDISISLKKVLSGMAMFALSLAGLIYVMTQMAKQADSFSDDAVNRVVKMLGAVGIVLAAITALSAFGSGDTTFSKKAKKGASESNTEKRSEFLKQARKMLLDMGILIAAMALFMFSTKDLNEEQFSRASGLLMGMAVIIGAIVITTQLIAKSISKTKNTSSMFGTFIAITVMMGTLIAALVVLMNYFKDYDFEKEWPALVATFGALVIVVGAIILFLRSLAKIKSSGAGLALFGFASIIVALGGVIALLVYTIKDEDLGKAGIIAAGLMACLLIIVALIKWLIKSLSEHSIGKAKAAQAAILIIAMVGSLVLIATAIGLLTGLVGTNGWAVARLGAVTAILMGALTGLVALFKWISEITQGKGVMTKPKINQSVVLIGAMVVALVVVATTIGIFTATIGTDPWAIMRATSVVVILMGALAALIGLFQWLSDSLTKNGLGKAGMYQVIGIVSTMVVAFILIAATIGVFTAKVGKDNWKEALIVAGILSGTIAVLIGLASLLVYMVRAIDWSALGIAGAALGGMVVAFAVIAYVISKVVELNHSAGEMLAKASVISLVILELEVLVAGIIGLGKLIEKFGGETLFGGIALAAMIAMFWWLEYVFSKIDAFSSDASSLLAKSQTISLVMLELIGLVVGFGTAIGALMNTGIGVLIIAGAALGMIALSFMIDFFDHLADVFVKIDAIKTEGIMAKSQTLILTMLELEVLGLVSILCIGAYIGGYGLSLMIDYFDQLADVFVKIGSINSEGMMSKAQILILTMLELEALGLVSVLCVGAYVGGYGLSLMIDYFDQLAEVFIKLDQIKAEDTLPTKVDLIISTLLKLEGLGALSFVDILAAIGQVGLGPMVQFFSDVSDVMTKISESSIDESTYTKAQYIMSVLDTISGASWGTLGGVIAGLGAGGLNEMVPLLSSLVDVAEKINGSGIASMDSAAVEEALEVLIDALDELADVDGGNENVTLLVQSLGQLAALSGSTNGIVGLAQSIERLSEVSSMLNNISGSIVNEVESIIDGIINTITGSNNRIYEASKDLVMNMKTAIDDINAEEWGHHLIENFVAGINSGVGPVEMAVARIAQTIRDYIGHTEPAKGALAGGEEIFGIHMDQNLANGITNGEGLVEDAASGMVSKGKEILSGFVDVAGDTGSDASEGFLDKLKNIIPGVSNITSAAGGMFDGLLNKIFGVNAALNAISSSWARGWGTMSDYQYQLRTEVSMQSKEVDRLTSRYNELKKAGSSSANEVGKRLDDANKQLKSTQERLDGIGKASEDIDNLTESFDELAGGGGGGGGARGAADAVKDFGSELENVLNGQMNIFSKFEEKEAMSKDELLSNMRSQIEGMSKWAANMESLAIKGIDQGLYEKLAMMGPEGAQYVAAFNSMTAEELAQANQLWAQSLALPSSVAKRVTASFNGIGTNIMAGWNQGMLDGMSECVETAGTAATNMYDRAAVDSGVASPSWKYALIGMYCMLGFRDGIRQYMRIPIDAMKFVCNQMLADAKAILKPEKFAEIGINLIYGIVEGLTDKDAIAALTEKLRWLASLIENGAADPLDIESPSKVFRDFIGKNIVLGLVEGLKEYSPLAEYAAEDLGNKTIDSMRSIIAEAAQNLLEDDEFNPVITPVLDLTNVSDGARRINSMFTTNQALAAMSSMSNLQNAQLDPNNPNSRFGTTFIQNNYSPKALNRMEIYRQTRNQFSQYREAMR